MTDPDTNRLVEELADNQLRYSGVGLLGGILSIILGFVLFLMGVFGATSWSAQFLGFSSQLVDAAPGTLLFVVGLLVIYVTRYNVDPKDVR
jgi:uncharacterized protein YjeT (DUF2065 family)